MLKVLYICPSSGLGGAESFIKTVSSQHSSQCVQDSYLLFSTGPLFDFLTQTGKQVFLLPERPRLSRAKTILKTQSFIANIIKKNKIDLVHSTMAYATIFAAPAARNLCRHIWFQHGPASGWQDRIAALLPHNGIITNSHFTTLAQQKLEKPISRLLPQRKWLELTLGTQLSPVTKIQVQNYRNDWLKKLNLPADTLFINMISRLQHWKGIHLFIEAIKRLQQNYNSTPIYSIIWGEASAHDHSYYTDLQKMIQGQPITLAGPIQNPVLAYSISEIVVNASLQPEPFGLSLIEAMGYGAIPVAANAGGPKEFITDKVNGALFQAHSAKSLAEVLSQLLLDESLRLKIKQTGQESFRQKFTAEKMVNHLEAFYQSLF